MSDMERCPICDSDQYVCVAPDRQVAFTKDRVCQECGSKWQPATPRWAGWAFVALGTAFLLIAVLATRAFLAHSWHETSDLRMAGDVQTATIWSVIGYVVGGGAMRFGYRSLRQLDGGPTVLVRGQPR